jgi:NAD(P)-dependent dehydrogenase (short-subunit alcohol dehydrogenase family)
MDLQLKGRHALVTGSTLGIGYAIAEGLAAEGAEVTITGRKPDSVERSLAKLRKAAPGAKVAGIAADCATEEGAEAVFRQLPDIDILVNNLGIFEPKPFFEIPDADWMRFFETNLVSGVRFSRRYAPAMAKRGWGRILFVSSESAINIPREMIHYGVTKTAQLALSRGLAIEFATTGVTVNTIMPGPTKTEGVITFVEQNAKAAGKSAKEFEADFFKTMRPSSLIKRFADPKEVANLAVYLCGAGASATTGAALRVDGGLVNTII